MSLFSFLLLYNFTHFTFFTFYIYVSTSLYLTSLHSDTPTLLHAYTLALLHFYILTFLFHSYTLKLYFLTLLHSYILACLRSYILTLLFLFFLHQAFTCTSTCTCTWHKTPHRTTHTHNVTSATPALPIIASGGWMVLANHMLVKADDPDNHGCHCSVVLMLSLMVIHFFVCSCFVCVSCQMSHSTAKQRFNMHVLHQAGYSGKLYMCSPHCTIEPPT